MRPRTSTRVASPVMATNTSCHVVDCAHLQSDFCCSSQKPHQWAVAGRTVDAACIKHQNRQNLLRHQQRLSFTGSDLFCVRHPSFSVTCEARGDRQFETLSGFCFPPKQQRISRRSTAGIALRRASAPSPSSPLSTSCNALRPVPYEAAAGYCWLPWRQRQLGCASTAQEVQGLRRGAHAEWWRRLAPGAALGPRPRWGRSRCPRRAGPAVAVAAYVRVPPI